MKRKEAEGEEEGVIPALEVKRLINDNRVFQNELIRYDDKGQKI